MFQHALNLEGMPHPKNAPVRACRQQQSDSTKFTKVPIQQSNENESDYQPQYDSSVSTEGDNGSGDRNFKAEGKVRKAMARMYEVFCPHQHAKHGSETQKVNAHCLPTHICFNLHVQTETEDQ